VKFHIGYLHEITATLITATNRQTPMAIFSKELLRVLITVNYVTNKCKVTFIRTSSARMSVSVNYKRDQGI
jgi:hypothetical protein